jgi:hypothetical protein
MRFILVICTWALFALMEIGLFGAMSHVFDPPPPASPFYVIRQGAA